VRKRKDTYAKSKVAQKRAAPPSPEMPEDRPTLARINSNAMIGQAGLSVGDRVKIESSGLYAGQIGRIERLMNGVIPSALVRFEGGGGRQVRTIDLTPTPAEEP
jgi:hypothetical protein